MRLRALIPTLEQQRGGASTFITSLEAVGIKTSEDLLFAVPPAELFARLALTTPHASFTFPDFLAFQGQIATLASASGENGAQVYTQEQEIQLHRTGGEIGLKELDELVGGSLGIYGVVELSGPVASFLASHVLLRYLALHVDSSTLWLDTTGDFSEDQASGILSNLVAAGHGYNLPCASRCRRHIMLSVHLWQNWSPKRPRAIPTPQGRVLWS